MRRRLMLTGMLGMPSLALAQRVAPPHAWIFGSWIGGQFPVAETNAVECFGGPTVIFTRDLVLRSTPLDLTFRQRAVETVSAQGERLEFRLAPLMGGMSVMGATANRVPPDFGFGCDNNPNILRVERRGPDEIVFPGCSEFPSNFRRCK